MQPQRLSAFDVELAPQAPGIYAWYAQLALSVDDWHPRIKDGIDLAARDLDRAIADYAQVHSPEPVALRGDGSYGLNWSGEIRRDNISDHIEGNFANAVDSHLSRVSPNPEGRKLLTALLHAATPIFASPLYIGVATNLRVRLSQHKADYELAKTEIHNDPSSSNRLQFHGSSFGARVAGAGVQMECLECWILPTGDIIDSKESDRHQRNVAEVAEWVLQRIFLPVLGRN